MLKCLILHLVLTDTKSHKWEKEKLARYIKLDDYQAEGFFGHNLAEAPESEKKSIELKAGSLMLTGTLIHRGFNTRLVVAVDG